MSTPRNLRFRGGPAGTQLLGVIGQPLAHSLSPAFQQAALDALGIDARYEAWEVGPEELGALAQHLRGPQYLGANVTVPYKEAVVPLLDALEGEARLLGAVNTIVNRQGRLLGYNTDVQGFLEPLLEAGFRPQGKSAVLLGAGGAARAAALALLRAGVASLAIANRTLARAQGLVAALEPHRGGAELLALPLAWEGPQGVPHEIADFEGAPQARAGRVREAALAAPLARCHLLVNATAVGLAHGPQADALPMPAHLIPPQALVYDIVANPEETPLLREARRRGCETLGGLLMLVYQGAASFRLWTGREAPLEAMLAAARGALAGAPVVK